MPDFAETGPSIIPCATSGSLLLGMMDGQSMSLSSSLAAGILGVESIPADYHRRVLRLCRAACGSSCLGGEEVRARAL